jgi:hypothetical protein
MNERRPVRNLGLDLHDGLYRVNWRGICAGFEVKNGRIKNCAPILRRRIDFFKTIAERIGP